LQRHDHRIWLVILRRTGGGIDTHADRPAGKDVAGEIRPRPGPESPDEFRNAACAQIHSALGRPSLFKPIRGIVRQIDSPRRAARNT
jgi:hypothetical protein